MVTHPGNNPILKKKKLKIKRKRLALVEWGARSTSVEWPQRPISPRTRVENSPANTLTTHQLGYSLTGMCVWVKRGENGMKTGVGTGEGWRVARLGRRRHTVVPITLTAVRKLGEGEDGGVVGRKRKETCG